VKTALESSLRSKLGYLLIHKALQKVRKNIDYSEAGGAPLLGVRGNVVIGHGRSDAREIKNAIRVAEGMNRSKVNETIELELSAAAAARVANG
jgi:phosphate acyltransferase